MARSPATTPRPVRYRCELYADLALEVGDGLRVRVLEISEGGAFLEQVPGTEDLQVGERASLSIALPGGDPWRSHVRVSRHGSGRLDLHHPKVDHVTVAVPGYGVEFDGMDDDELERLRDFLELLDNR